MVTHSVFNYIMLHLFTTWDGHPSSYYIYIYITYIYLYIAVVNQQTKNRFQELDALRKAAKSLQAARSGDLEEEDEGHELMKCHRSLGLMVRCQPGASRCLVTDGRFSSPGPSTSQHQISETPMMAMAHVAHHVRFTSKHPHHQLTFALANEFAFPDPEAAWHSLAGWIEY